MHNLFFRLSLILVMIFSSVQVFASSSEALRLLPMQENGRTKPYDTFARESLMLIHGKTTYQKRPAHEIIFTWFLLPEPWAKKPIVQVKYKKLKESLKLPVERSYFSPQELMESERFPLLLQELAGQRQAGAKLDPYYQSIQRLEGQLGLFKSISAGEVFRIVPPKEGTKWIAVGDPAFPKEILPKLQRITGAFIQAIGHGMQKNQDSAKGEAVAKEMDAAVTGFVDAARAINPELYPSSQEMSIEAHYNSFDPFKWSWIAYLIGCILLGISWYSSGRKTYVAAWALMIIGFVLHTYGFGLRSYIAERPPVTNMYETVVWVSWGAMLFSFIIEAVYKQRFILLCGTIGAVFCLVLTSMAPSILDAAIDPLQPVLVSNFWLLIHVLTITISYSAFLLGFFLGDVGLGMSIINEQKYKKQIAGISNAIYRATQIGVVLLAAGTILGGIWADYSWGRFWGWDPKETWALIALLGYLAVLHGRLAGWLNPFGMCASAVASFSLVIMAWYGVNFVLGAGLHSYGFGGGGIQYVSGFVGIHFVYVVYAIVARNKVRSQTPAADV